MAKVFNTQKNNPRYWGILVERSRYSEAEINQTLDNVQKVNFTIDEIHERIEILLTNEHGRMTPITGFTSDNHRKLSILSAELNTVYPSFSDNGHADCLPVRKWQTEVAKTWRQIGEVEKLIKNLS